jgi:hypothetical protein
MERGWGSGVRGRGARRAILVLWAVAIRGVSAQDAGLHASANAERLRVGDPVTVQVRAELGEGAEIVDRAPRMRDTLPEGVRLLSVDSIVRSAGAFEGAVRLAVLRTGVHVIPPFIVSYRARSGSAIDSVVSAPVSVAVISVLAGPSEAIRDIKDIARSSLRRWLREAGLALVVVLVAVSWVVVRRRLRQRALASEPPAPLEAKSSPYERALERLHQIEQARLSARGDVALHYQAVADVLRGYLAEEERVPALERTTPEVLGILPSPLDQDDSRDQLRRLLGEADLVKFALVRPGPEAAEQYLRAARELLERWHGAAEPELVGGGGDPLDDDGHDGDMDDVDAEGGGADIDDLD